MIEPDDLTLAGIDGIRHLITNEMLVKAVAFAVRNTGRKVHTGRDDRTAYRFVTALVMTNTLEASTRWPKVLKTVMDLEAEKES